MFTTIVLTIVPYLFLFVFIPLLNGVPEKSQMGFFFFIFKYPEPAAAAAKSLQSCPTLCNPIDSSPLGSSVPGILQARILEWVAISFSGGLPDSGIKPGSPALWADSLPSEPPGKLCVCVCVCVYSKVKSVSHSVVSESL